MNRKSLAYSALLVIVLALTSVLFNRGFVQGVINEADVRLRLVDSIEGTLPAGTLPPTNTDHLLGQTIRWVGNIDFADQEEATIHLVRLLVNGPQPLDVSLPLQEGTFDLSSSPGVSGQLTVDVSFDNVSLIDPPSSELPNSTLPSGGQFKGVSAGARITYNVSWTPPVFLDPAPEFTLIPETDVLFAIPQLTPPEGDSGTVLPQTDLKFPIPILDAPSGTVLPNLEALFDVPQLTVSSTAPETLPDIPNTTFSFNIPQVSVPSAPTGVDRNFPDSTASYDIPQVAVESAPPGVPDLPATAQAFAVPDLAALGLIPTAPSGIANFPDSSQVFSIPGDASPRGLATDGTDFWMILDGSPRDQIVKVDASGNVLAGPVNGPSDLLDGITFLNGFLWIIENKFRCDEDINGDSVIDENRCDRSHRIFKVDPGSLPANDNAWAALFPSTVNAPSNDLWREIGGITAQGSGSTGTLWLADANFGDVFFNIEQSGSAIKTVFVNEPAGRMDSAAFNDGTLYTSNGGTITTWTTEGVKRSAVATNPLRDSIRGMTFKTVDGRRVLYFASQTDKKVYGTFFATTVTQNPRGLAYSSSSSSAGEALWAVLDGSPKDKIVKLNPSTGAVISNFGPASNGVADSPSADTEGITYLSDFLWVIANEGFVRKLYKLNSSTGATVQQFDLGSTASIFDDLGGLTHDGTNLVSYSKDFNTVFAISPSDGTRQDIQFPCCPPTLNGARGLAHHAGRDKFYFAKGGKLGRLNASFQFEQEQSLTESGNALSGIQGLVFNGNVLYVAIDGKINVGFLATVVTTSPKGVVVSPSSSAVGRALWIVVDGSPVDKLMKVNADTGAIVTAFGTDGAVDAPSDKVEGLAFLNDSLWLVANSSHAGAQVFRLNPADGSVSSVLNLRDTASIWDDLGGITTMGGNLVVWSRSGNSAWMINPADGQRTGFEQTFPCCPSFFGARGLAYHAGRNQYFAANGGKIGIFDGDQLGFVQEVSAKAAGSNISGIEGLAFEDDVLYIVRSGKVSKGFLATTVTTEPRGLAYTSSDSAAGRALWVLVDGDPKDKLLKIDPSTGDLITSFGSGGYVDAPSSKTEGIVFLSGSLWIIANENFERKLYQINVSNGSITDTFNLSQTLSVWDDLGGLTTDGTNLIAYARTFNKFWVIDSNISSAEQKFTCCPSLEGARALTYHSGRGEYFAGRSGKLFNFDANFNFLGEQSLKEDGANISGVEGLVINGDVVYVARSASGVGKISSGALRTTITTNPRAIAFSPDGTSYQGSPIGRALWVVVDGDPKDVVLKLDADTGALLETFSTDGAADAPSKNIAGMTFLSNFLWLIGNDPDGQKLYKINATDGSVLDTFNLSTSGGSFGIWEQLGGLTTDGTDLLAYGRQSNSFFRISTSGEPQTAIFPCCPTISGATGLAHRSSKSQLFASKGNTIVQYVIDGDNLFTAEEYKPSTITDIQGMTFVDDMLYLTHVGSGKVARASIPPDITSNPLALAYDSGANELYILVDGKGKDHVIVVQPEPDGSGNAVVIRNFSVNSNEAEGLVLLNGELYVAAMVHTHMGPQNAILVHNPVSGAEVRVVNPAMFERILGMSTDGVSLIVSTEFGGPRAVYIDPADGDIIKHVFYFDPQGSFIPEGHQGIAVRTAPALEFFPVRGSRVFRFDEFGRLIEAITVNTSATSTFGNIKGATFVGNMLYLADKDGKNIHATGIPRPPTIITTDPRAMATDGTDLYVVVQASPRDKILKLDAETGELVPGFGDGGAVDAPGTETDAAAYHNGSLYVVTNDKRTIEDPFNPANIIVAEFPMVHQLDAATGAELDRFPIMIPIEFGTPMPLMDHIGALASDGMALYAGVKGNGGIQGVWFRIDPANPGAPAQPVHQFAGRFAFLPGLHGFEVTQGELLPENRRLVASGSTFPGGPADFIARFNRETGVMYDQYMLAGKDIRGLAYIGITLFMADAGSDSILGTSLPENTVELTVAGSYQGHLMVDFSPDLDQTLTHNYGPVAFNIIRNPEVRVAFTTIQPQGGAPVPLTGGFILTNDEVTINGLVNDPSINQVLVGIRLPFTTLVNDEVTPGTPGSNDIWAAESLGPGSGANWHIRCYGATEEPKRVSSPDCSWRYGVPGQLHFNTGSITAGALRLKSAFEVDHGTRLAFKTGYVTEFAADRDIKTIEVAEVTTDLQGNDQLGAWQPILQIVGKGAGSAPPPPGAHPSFRYVELEPLFINPNLQHVEADLSPFAGKRVVVRLRFDSVNRFANDGEGWYVDDIRIEGAGFKTVTAPTTPLSTPTMVDGVRYHRAFTTPFLLAEGLNEVGTLAIQPYSPFLEHGILIEGFVDQTAPAVALFGLPGATSNLLQTLQGSVQDATFQSLEITQTNPDGSSQVIFSLTTLSENGTFSLPVSLSEGVNTFQARAVDGGGLEATTDPLQVIGDTTPPSGQVSIVTMTSQGQALIGDQFFVVVAAQDTLSGVSQVLDANTGTPLVPMTDAPDILVEMHNLSLVGGQPATHLKLAAVQAGTPVGINSVPVRILDNAGNEAVVNGTLHVVSARSNRNFFLFPGVNFMGLALIPDDGDPSTDDDAMLDRLMTQDVTNLVSAEFASALGGTVTLGDVVESTFAFNDAGNFIVHTPGDGAADTLTELTPFQGMIIKTRETANVGGTDVPVFKKVNVAGFTAQQAVPVRVNIQGVFFRQNELPPNKTLRTGYNLIAPHILGNTLFDTVYRGALIPNELAVSAITFERRVDAESGTAGMSAEIFEGFVTNSLGDLLKPALSYWTFVVDNPLSTTPPTITP